MSKHPLSTETTALLNLLTSHLTGNGKTGIACSGGIDSTLLLYAACKKSSSPVTAFTVKSVLVPDEDIAEAATHASLLGVEHIIIDLDISSIPEIIENTPQRCYYCKKRVFSAIIAKAESMGINTIYEGTHHDDRSDYRPGLKAIMELNIKSPLKEAGFNKDSILELARYFGIGNWSRVPSPCLATRIPYGRAITNELINKVYKSEKFIRTLGFSQVRVRIHDNIARIETGEDDYAKFLDKKIRFSVESELKKIGFDYVTVDLGGYRRGSMNIGIEKGGNRFG